VYIHSLFTLVDRRLMLQCVPSPGTIKSVTKLLAYGPLIKRCPIDQSQRTHEHLSEHKHKKSE